MASLALAVAAGGVSVAFAQSVKTYGPVVPGETFATIALRLAPEFPSLTPAQIQRGLRATNPGLIRPDSATPKSSDALGTVLLVPREFLVRDLLGLPPLQGSRPAVPAVDAASAPAPAPGRPAQQAPKSDAALPPSSGDAQADYLALAALAPQRAGEAGFDYRYGVAALDAGEPGVAALALQRVVWSDPQFAGARFDLARAHLALGDTQSARIELEHVRRSNPPPQVATAVDRYLARMDATAAADDEQTQFVMSLRGQAGYDSNANAATGDRFFDLGGIPIRLDEDSRSTESAFYGARGLLRLSHKLSEAVELYADGGAGARLHPDADFVDTADTRARFGVVQALGKQYFRVGLGGHYSLLDARFNNRGIHSDFALGRATKTYRAELLARSGLLRFTDRLALQDVNQIAGGVALTVQPAPKLRATVTGLIGQDTAQRANSPYSRDLSGARLALLWRAATAIDARFSAGFLNSDYKRLFAFSNTLREDEQLSADLSVNLRGVLPGDLVLTPSLRYIDNDSTIPLFDYDRTVFGVAVQRDF